VRLQDLIQTRLDSGRCGRPCQKRIRLNAALSVVVAVLFFSGCTGIQTPDERQARKQVQAVSGNYRPGGHKPALPILTTNSGLGDFLTYAMLNQPKVEAAYFDWVASVERITVQRSLPDPQLTFQMDVQDVVTSLMPGLMMSFPGMGKLRAAGAIATSESQAKYFAFRTVSQQSAFEVKRTFYRLYFLEEKIRVNRESLGLLRDLEKLARAQNEVGKVTLQDVLRAQIEQDRLKNEIANLEDSRGPLLAQFKAALGMRPDEPAPKVPARFESTPLDLTADKSLEAALAESTLLKGMAAEVRAADASIRLAYKARMPDTTIGLMADAKTSPTLYRPWGTVSLPLWRDKLAAQVAEAQANKLAGEARLSAEQIALAVAVAERAFLYREATRNLELLRNGLLPKQRQSVEVARSGYLGGQIDFFNLTDAEQTLLRFGLDDVEARTQRELTLAELSYIVQGMPPGGEIGSGMGVSRLGAGISSGGMGSSGGAMLPNNSAPSKRMNQ